MRNHQCLKPPGKPSGVVSEAGTEASHHHRWMVLCLFSVSWPSVCFWGFGVRYLQGTNRMVFFLLEGNRGLLHIRFGFLFMVAGFVYV